MFEDIFITFFIIWSLIGMCVILDIYNKNDFGPTDWKLFKLALSCGGISTLAVFLQIGFECLVRVVV